MQRLLHAFWVPPSLYQHTAQQEPVSSLAQVSRMKARPNLPWHHKSRADVPRRWPQTCRLLPYLPYCLSTVLSHRASRLLGDFSPNLPQPLASASSPWSHERSNPLSSGLTPQSSTKIVDRPQHASSGLTRPANMKS